MSKLEILPEILSAGWMYGRLPDGREISMIYWFHVGLLRVSTGLNNTHK